jgi:hypothetical protein
MSGVVAYWEMHLQAHDLHAHIARLPEALDLEAIIVSPLSRALQTAVGAFGGLEWNSEKESSILMVALEGIPVCTQTSRAYATPLLVHLELPSSTDCGGC